MYVLEERQISCPCSESSRDSSVVQPVPKVTIPKRGSKEQDRQCKYNVTSTRVVQPLLKWERLKAGESNGKLPPRPCPGCNVPEPYRSHDWALVPAKPGLQGWILVNEFRFCVCSLSYPVCNAHAPYYTVICTLSGSTTFFHIISHTAQFPIKTVFWFSLQLFSHTFTILRITEQYMIINVHRFSFIRPVRPKLFHAGGRTDMTKLTIASRNFVNASKNESNRTIYQFMFTFLWEAQILFRRYQIRDGSTNPSTGLQYKIWPKTSPSIHEFIKLHHKIFLLLQFNEKVYWTKFYSQHLYYDIYKYLASFAQDAFRKARGFSFKVIFFLPESNHNWNFQRIKIPR